YALTASPTINASVVRQFWGSTSEVSLPNRVKGLVATIDGTAYTVTEASIRSALQQLGSYYGARLPRGTTSGCFASLYYGLALSSLWRFGTQRQAELDMVALNLTNEEWIGLVDQVRANLTLSAELLGADVSKDTFSVRMVELMNQRRKAIAEMKAKAKREKPMTPAQQKEFMRTFNIYDKICRAVDLAIAKDHHQHLKRSGETLESSDSKKLKSSHNTTQPAVLQEPTSVSVGASIAVGAPIPAVTPIPTVTSIPAVTFVPAGSSIPAVTPSAAGVSTTAGASGSASDASVLIIELLDSPPKETSIPLDPEREEQDATLRKHSRKKSIARRISLPSAYKPKSDALPFDEDDPEAEFKRYLRQASD
nr:xylulose kinase-1 [Tanacetum cinerariifolium]